MMIPYTYCITHKSSGKRYYGARYAKNCHPSDLWVRYFTSSEVVKRIIDEEGKEAFFIQIRKTFKTAEECVAWEYKVLRRLKVHKNPSWLNISVIGSPTKEMLVKAMQSKYGVDNCMQLQEIREKIRNTNIERYGVPVPLMLPEIQAKARTTYIQNYGVEYGIQNQKIREKMQTTVKQKYGVDNVFQSEEIKQKIRETNLSNYGFPYPQQNKEWMDKFVDDLMAKKGKTRVKKPSYSSNDLTPAQKRSETNIEKFGTENVFGSEFGKSKAKSSMLEKYGVEWSMQSPAIKVKAENTCKNNYGVKTYLLTEECSRKLKDWWENAPIIECYVCGYKHTHPGLMSMHHNANCKWKKIECIESGAIFKNSQELLSYIQKELGKVNAKSIQPVQIVCNGGRCKSAYGYHWRYATESDLDQSTNKDV